MLSSFSVTNFKSIKETATLDLQATTLTEHSDRIVLNKLGEKLLPFAVIYGPNGAGKSNILEALFSMTRMILVPYFLATLPKSNQRVNSSVAVNPFAFDPVQADAPTEFVIYFCGILAEYRYELHAHGSEIVYEKLDRKKYETKKVSNIFYRNEDELHLTGEFSKLSIPQTLSPNLPVLSYLGITQIKHPVVEDVIGWFTTKIIVVNYGDPFVETNMIFKITDDRTKKLVLAMMKEMDVDVVDYRIEDLPNESFQIFTKHIVNEKEYELNLRDESSGTQKLFALLPLVANALVLGKALVIDELDSKLHPMLLNYLIKLFANKSVNRHGAQLIFTSHDLTTMTRENFRRDEIWFVAKGDEQNSILYAMSDFKGTRSDDRYGKQYIAGKYGADPYLKKIIDWESL